MSLCGGVVALKWISRRWVRAAVAFGGLVGIPVFPGMPQVTAAPAEDRPRVDSAASIGDLNAIVPAVMAAFGERYGFMHIDEDEGPAVIEVGVVDTTIDDSETLLAVTSGSSRLRVVSAEYSAQQIDEWSRDAYEFMAALGIRPTHVFLNYARQEVIVSVPRMLSAEELAQFEARFHDRVAVEVSERSGFLTNASRDSYPPYEGGLNWNGVTGTELHACTSGFTLRNAATGFRYATAAEDTVQTRARPSTSA